MDFLISLLALVALACFFIYKYVLAPIFFPPLSRIPTPNILCSTTNWLSKYLAWREQEFDWLIEAHRRHGPLIRTGPTSVSINSVEGLRETYISLEKDPFYRQFASYNGVPNLFSTLDSKTHSAQKRILSGVYSKSYLQRSKDMKAISGVVLDQQLMPLLEHYADTKTPVNVYPIFEAVGIDFLSAYAFGLDISTKRLQGHDQKRQADFQNGKDSIWTSISRRSEHLWFPENECLALCKTAADNIDEKRAPATTKPVVFEKLYTALSQVSPLKTRAEPDAIILHCASELRDQLIASREGLAITLTYIFYHLAKDATLQIRLRQELSNNTPANLESLPLLNAILMEILRLHAPGAGRHPRLAPASGMTIHGHFIPAGTSISASSYVLHRNEAVFPDAESFCPERWLNPTEEMRRWSWAFGSGGRMCIGNHFAMIVLRGVVATVFGGGLECWVVDDTGTEQTKTFLAGPRQRKMVLGIVNVNL